MLPAPERDGYEHFKKQDGQDGKDAKRHVSRHAEDDLRSL